jgi:hypothetical protein
MEKTAMDTYRTARWRTSPSFFEGHYFMARTLANILSVFAAVATFLTVNCCAAQDGLTTVRITSKVLVANCDRLGINLGGDAYYSGAALVKRRVRANFEGTSYRQCHFGPV